MYIQFKASLFSIVILAGAAMASEKPSFNCDAVNINITESTICLNEGISVLDSGIANLYKSILKNEAVLDNQSALKVEQLKWIKKRNKCLDSKDCIIDEYIQRFVELETIGKKLSENLTASTSIKDPILIIGFADGGDEYAWRGKGRRPNCTSFADLNHDGRSELLCGVGCGSQMCPMQMFLSTIDGYEKLNSDFTDRSVLTVISKIPEEISKKYIVLNGKINGWSVIKDSNFQGNCSDNEEFYAYDLKSYKVVFSRTSKIHGFNSCP